MSSPNPMTREELIESAALDAFGLLDEYETALYTRSFHHAPAAVQDEIIAMQADFVSDDRLLPQGNPDPTLRERVLDAVHEAIEKESVQLEPLATIGGRPRRDEAEVAGVIHNGSAARYWRAAAFVLAGAVMVVAYFASVAYHHSILISEMAMNSRAESQLRDLIGKDFSNFVNNPDCVAHVLKPVKSDFPGVATVFVNKVTNEVFLLGVGIPQTNNESYTLSIRQPDGTVTPQQENFTSNGLVIGKSLGKIDVGLLANATWQITKSAGAVILSSV